MSNTNGTHELKLTDLRKSAEGYVEAAKEGVEHTAHEATKAVEKELGRARRTVARVAAKVEKSAKANPLATAAVLVGAGAVLGALLHAALRPEPTAGELIARSLRRGAASAGDELARGLERARNAYRIG